MSIQKEVSNKQEKYIAKRFADIGGKLVPASGGTKFDCGDVRISDKFLIECKTITKDQISFSIKKSWLEKVKEQAFEQGIENSCLAFRFGPDDKDHVVISLDLFECLIRNYLEVQKNG